MALREDREINWEMTKDKKRKNEYETTGKSFSMQEQVALSFPNVINTFTG